MKKILVLMLALLMVLSLAACGEKTSAGEDGKEKTTDVKWFGNVSCDSRYYCPG